MEGSMTEFRTLRAGIFLPPFHPNDEDPLLCMERDFDLMEWLNQLRYPEAWNGGAHSGRMAVSGPPQRCPGPPPMPTPPIRLRSRALPPHYAHPLHVEQPLVQLAL